MRNKPKTEKSETKRKTISLGEFDNQLERQSKLTKATGIAGLALGTVFLSAGIFLPKEINELWERIFEFSAGGISYAAAVGSYALYKLNQFQTTEFHMKPEYMEEFEKSLKDLF